MSTWKNKTELANPIGFWLCIGLAIGSGLGVAVGHFALGIAAGILTGAVIGYLQKQHKAETDK
ncbi:MAG: hypothetical protein KJ556_12515 [Gammaproteobacteria bacterium]|nr:hypothetical protein [Gammaproteobacteria bacterium]MBU2057350.1 hypothetical protein [Gammaproteobacteria bacterium]MBU2175943.1 hypothetical protein [Gammaproteobacteria bacterium]MBU2248928.1 hypothetical protein [Gammaproteobacteria bacterium]MBU2344523.1 hypothetical protein [Gammaproteobacteria bacterium]